MSWFADALTGADEHWLSAVIGQPHHMALWELLAILVAVRLWRGSRHESARIGVRSDSLSALSALIRGSSPNPAINKLVAELLLDEAELSASLGILTHIPGAANSWPDALSRLSAPEQASVPPALSRVPRSAAPPRDKTFWRVVRL